jgi:hypothetical protein
MTGDVVNLRAFDPVNFEAPVKKVSVPATFIQTFLTVVDFCVKQDPLENKAVPTNRIKKIWKMVTGGAVWNQTYFQVVRDRLNKMGIVHIFDRCHDNGKAWRWDTGSNFPAETWKEDQRQLDDKAKQSRFGVSFEEFIASTDNLGNEQVHNTLYHTDALIQDLGDRNPDIRPPPD